MHISVGKYEGCQIVDSEKRGPLSTRELTVKETMFDLIGTRINESEVLDINDFNGICGIESLSRGAKKCYFLGEDIDSYRLIEKNLKIVKAKNTNLIKENPKEYLKNLGEAKKFRIIFFEVQAQSDVGLEKMLVQHLTDDGIIIMMIPLFGGAFNVPTEVEGGCIQESRDCEQRQVLFITKVCET